MPMAPFRVAAQTKRDDKIRVEYPSLCCYGRLLPDTWLNVNTSLSTTEKQISQHTTAADDKL
jgi:hypothetical protein